MDLGIDGRVALVTGAGHRRALRDSTSLVANAGGPPPGRALELDNVDLVDGARSLTL